MSFSFGSTRSLGSSSIRYPPSVEPTLLSAHAPRVDDESRRTQFSSPFSIRAILSSSSVAPSPDRFLPASFSYRQLLFDGESNQLTENSDSQSLRCYQHRPVTSSDWQTETASRRHDKRKETGKAPKRSRTVFTPAQLERLEGAFTKQQYVAGEERRKLAASLQLTETHVKVWFQNRRIRFRKHGQATATLKSRVES